MIKNYLEEIYGYEEFTIGCIKADIEDVRKLISAKNTELDSKVTFDTIEGSGNAISLVQAKDSDWTIIIYILGYYMPAGKQHLVYLSMNLNTDVILHAMEDTSYTEVFEFFRVGKSTSDITYCDDQEIDKEEMLKFFEPRITGTFGLGEMSTVYQVFDIKPLCAVFDDGIILDPKSEPFLKTVVSYDGESFNWDL